VTNGLIYGVSRGIHVLPWEHAAIAYLLYSGYSRVRYGLLPAGWPVLVVVFASQLPDLIDKPLAWQFGLIPSGRSLAHSVFVAVPLVIVVSAIARRRDRAAMGAAFAIGYLSHLATDAVPLYPGAGTSFESILWPLVSQEHVPRQYDGVIEPTIAILSSGLSSMLVPSVNAIGSVGMVVVMAAVWLRDGKPGLQEIGWLLCWPIGALRGVVG